MRIPFRQGIIAAPPNFLDIQGTTVALSIPPSQPLEVSISFGDVDYLVVERTEQTTAWTIDPSTSNYLYIGLNGTTAVREFGVTHSQPVVQPTAPPYLENRHWYDTLNNVMKVCKNSAWYEAARVFVGAVTANQKLSPITWTITGPIVGTQVGNFTECEPSPILLDYNLRPIVRTNGAFLTKNSQLSSGEALLNPNIGMQTISKPAKVALLEGTVVALGDDGKFRPATYEDSGQRVVGICLNSAPIDNSVTVALSGIMTNPDWSWGSSNTPLYIDAGTLSVVDNHTTDIVNFPKKHPPIARTISSDTILFSMMGVSQVSETIRDTGLSVTLSGIQTVIGQKTFVSSPRVPTASTGENSTIAASTEWVKNQGYITENDEIVVTGDVVGSGRDLLNLVLSAVATPGTYTKVSVDATGRVVVGDVISDSDIPQLDVSKIDNLRTEVTSYYINEFQPPTGPINVGGQQLINVLNPVDDSDAATKNYVDISPNQLITITGDVSGDGTDTIELLLNEITTAGEYTKVTIDSTGRVEYGTSLDPDDIPTITTSKIGDFDEAVESKPLDSFAPPLGDVSFDGYKLVGVGDPDTDTDATNKKYVDDIADAIDGLLQALQDDLDGHVASLTTAISTVDATLTANIDAVEDDLTAVGIRVSDVETQMSDVGTRLADAELVLFGDPLDPLAESIEDKLSTTVASLTIRNIVQISQADYDALASPSADTLYLVVV